MFIFTYNTFNISSLWFIIISFKNKYGLLNKTTYGNISLTCYKYKSRNFDLRHLYYNFLVFTKIWSRLTAFVYRKIPKRIPCVCNSIDLQLFQFMLYVIQSEYFHIQNFLSDFFSQFVSVQDNYLFIISFAIIFSTVLYSFEESNVKFIIKNVPVCVFTHHIYLSILLSLFYINILFWTMR